jgi:endonuclease G
MKLNYTKYLSLGLMSLALTFTSCDPDEALPNGTILTTDSAAQTLVLKGYVSTTAGFSVLQPAGFSTPVYLKDQQLYGKQYSFLAVGTSRLDALTSVPSTSEAWQTAAEVREGVAYWVRYDGGSAYRFIKLRVVAIDGNNVDVEYVVMSETQERPNSNANAGYSEAAAAAYETPRLDGSHTYVAHYVSDGTILNYSLEWNAAKKHANWVAFSFDATTCQDLVSRTNNWAVDPLLPKEMQVDNTYHTNDGFDRGHLCASEDRVYSTEANDQTFYFSNMSPQLNSLNGGFWAKLEARVQTWGRQCSDATYDHVYVAKGGTVNELLTNFTGTVKGSDGVMPTTDANGYTIKGLACPKYYFMAVLAEKDGEYQSIAFLVEHKEGWNKTPTSEELQATVVTVDELESRTGIDFFCNLPDGEEEAVESSVDLNRWSW